jgi:AcrR family transcriptional regulator
MSRTRTVVPRTKPASVRREELLSAARQLFLEQGIGPTTVEDITARAGVAKGSFYLQFASKEALIEALRERFARDLLRGVEQAVAGVPGEDWKKKLSAWTRAAVAGYLESMRLHDLIFYAARPPDSAGMTDNPLIDHLLGVLLAGAHARAWQLDNPRDTAVFLFNGMHGIVEAHARKAEPEAQRVARQVEWLFFRTVGVYKV